MQSSTRFITNCDRYYKVRHGLLQIAMVPVHDLLFKVLKHISNHFKFQLQTINELDKLYTKTDMYIYFFRIPHNTPSLFVLKFCISSYLQKLFRKYSVLPIVQQKGVKQLVYYGELKSQHRVRQKRSYPLVLRTSTILNLVVRNPRVLVQKILLKTQKQSVIYFTAYYHIISPFAGKLTCLVTKARFLSQMELVKKQMIEMAVEW